MCSPDSKLTPTDEWALDTLLIISFINFTMLYETNHGSNVLILKILNLYYFTQIVPNGKTVNIIQSTC